MQKRGNGLKDRVKLTVRRQKIFITSMNIFFEALMLVLSETEKFLNRFKTVLKYHK